MAAPRLGFSIELPGGIEQGNDVIGAIEPCAMGLTVDRIGGQRSFAELGLAVAVDVHDRDLVESGRREEAQQGCRQPTSCSRPTVCSPAGTRGSRVQALRNGWTGTRGAEPTTAWIGARGFVGAARAAQRKGHVVSGCCAPSDVARHRSSIRACDRVTHLVYDVNR